MITETKVIISKRAEELIAQYLEACSPLESNLSYFSSPIDAERLVEWLHGEISTPTSTTKKSKQEVEFIMAALRAELLRDLFAALQGDSSAEKEEKSASLSAKAKFVLLATAGTILAACEGFDSAATMMGLFSVPIWATLLVGSAFAVLAITVFYGFNLVQVSQNLGVKLSDAPKLLDVYLLQMEQIKSLRKKINSYRLAELTTAELEHLEKLTAMLQIRFKELTESCRQFDLALKSPKMEAAKTAFSAVAGLLFFGGGFFAGQSVAVFMLGLAMAGVTPTFWPVILISVVVGLAAFSLYWYVERVGLDKLISGWLGLDEEKIEKLCDKNTLDEEAEELNLLKDKITSTASLTRRVAELEGQLGATEEPECVEDEYALPHQSTTEVRASSNIYSFHAVKTPSNPDLALVDADDYAMRANHGS